MRLLVFLYITFFAIFANATTLQREYRTYTGYNNSISNPLLGISHSVEGRFCSVRYVDGFSQMLLPPQVPGARAISNEVHSIVPEDSFSSIGASEMLTLFGQFVTHDIGWTPASNTSVSGGIQLVLKEMMMIPVPKCDLEWDPDCTGNKTIAAARAVYNTNAPPNVPRQFINEVNSWLDGSLIYGSDDDRATYLRSFVGGQLKVSPGFGGDFLPLNADLFPNSNDAKTFANNLLYLCGDQRCNENFELTAMHILWVREHNRVASELAKRHPKWSDELLYQEARRWVGAELQAIVANEYLPTMMGQRLPAYKGYNESMANNRTWIIGLEYQGLALRVGHTQIDNFIMQLQENRRPLPVNGMLRMKDIFSNPSLLNVGIDPVMRGLAYQLGQEVDPFIVPDLRNLMFGRPGAGGQDMMALDIQRGRDMGLPDYNTMRAEFGLEKVTSFEQISSNVNIQYALRRVYEGNVNNVDAIVGGLCEDHVGASTMGPLFTEMFLKQWLIIRDCDRFWYENTNLYTQEEIKQLNLIRLSDIILLNTNIGWIQRDVLHANSNPPPHSYTPNLI